MSGKVVIPGYVREALEELSKRLKEVLGNEFQLYLFGSYARGDWLRDSDIDLVVVSPRFRGIPKYLRAPMVRRLARPDLPFDILCYTPEELGELIRESTAFREVTTYWRRLR